MGREARGVEIMTDKELTLIAQYLTETMATDRGVAKFRRFTEDDWKEHLKRELDLCGRETELTILGDK